MKDVNFYKGTSYSFVQTLFL